MSDSHPDLFSYWDTRVHPVRTEAATRAAPDPASLDDDGLIEAIPGATLATAAALAAEAARRKLPQAVSALGRLCRNFSGYGMARLVPEQEAALRALAAIGGREAGQIVADLIAKEVVQGETLRVAVEAAETLQSRLEAALVIRLLNHADRRVRAAACGCAGRLTETIPTLLERLDDLHQDVVIAAACALGRMGRVEARPILIGSLRRDPIVDVIEAITLIADEEAIVILGRAGRDNPDLVQVILDTLEAIDHPLAERVSQLLLAGHRVVLS